MSKPDITTQDLFLRLGTTSQSRSAKADALFRRLRLDSQEQLTRTLSGAPRRPDASLANGERTMPAEFMDKAHASKR